MSEAAESPGTRVERSFARLGQEDRIGIMTHIVLGYPSLDVSRDIVDLMVKSGVDMIEVQIPFSDPTADGPVITAACQEALEGGVRVADAFSFMEDLTARHAIPFLFMSYFNIAFSFGGGEERGGGLREFVKAAARAGASGLIIPDIPPDQRREGYPEACRRSGIHPVYVVSPNITEKRLETVARVASGFLYATSRTGTTGKDVELETDKLNRFLARARDVCGLPVAVGFSISRRDQIDSLRGHAQMGVVGSHLIRTHDKDGLDGLERELKRLVGESGPTL